MKPMILTETVREAVCIGRKNHWWFRVVGNGEMITQPVYKDGWWLIPTPLDSTDIAKARKRIDALKSTGIPIQGVVVAHEAPRLLCAPKASDRPLVTQSAAQMALAVLKGVLLGTLTLASAVVLITTILPVLGSVVLLAGLVLIDPAIIVVLEDGTWLEVLTYYE